MSEEIIDIVDEQDKVIGTETIAIAHEKRLLHRSATVFVFKDASFKEILLQKRSKTVRNNPGKYCTPGGHLQTGETYLDTGRREFCEEMLSILDDTSLQLEELFKVRKNADNDSEFLMAFRLVHSGPFTPDSKEVEEAIFMNMDELFQKIKEEPDFFNETTVLVMNEYKKRYL